MDYKKEYAEFIAKFNLGPVSGFEVGELISRMANYYSDYNLMMIEALRVFSNVRREFEGQSDANGKPISSSKAEVLADATDEANKFRIARAHVQNIEQIINAAKAMQRGVLNEYAYTAQQ